MGQKKTAWQSHYTLYKSLIEDTVTNIGYLCVLACDLSSSGTKWQNYIPYNTAHYSGFHYDI